MIMITRMITFAIPTRQKLSATRDVKVLLKFSNSKRKREREREREMMPVLDNSMNTIS